MRTIRENLKMFLYLLSIILIQSTSQLNAQDSINNIRKSYFWVTGGIGEFSPYKIPKSSSRGDISSSSYIIGLSYQGNKINYSIDGILNYKTYEFGVSEVKIQDLNLSIWHGKGIYSLRYISEKEEELSRVSPEEFIHDFGILYGRGVKTKFGSATFSAGLSMLSGVERGEYLGSAGLMRYSVYETIKIRTIGIPFDAQLFWTPVRFMGIGAKGFGNINNSRSYIGGMLCFQIGILH